MRESLSGKKVLITGSSMGIGKGLSVHFAKEGASLALADHPREEEHLVEWAQELGKTYGIKTWTFCVDLTEPDGPERLHDEVSRTMGAIHTLVNMRVSAGTASSKICLLTGAPEHDSAQLHGICETEPSVPASYD